MIRFEKDVYWMFGEDEVAHDDRIVLMAIINDRGGKKRPCTIGGDGNQSQL